MPKLAMTRYTKPARAFAACAVMRHHQCPGRQRHEFPGKQKAERIIRQHDQIYRREKRRVETELRARAFLRDVHSPAHRNSRPLHPDYDHDNKTADRASSRKCAPIQGIPNGRTSVLGSPPEIRKASAFPASAAENNRLAVYRTGDPARRLDMTAPTGESRRKGCSETERKINGHHREPFGRYKHRSCREFQTDAPPAGGACGPRRNQFDAGGVQRLHQLH